MNHNDSRYPEDWFKIGEKEIKRAKNLMALADLEGAGFNIQQSIEKYLKGYLISKGWQLRRTHNLEILINDAVVYDSSFEEFRTACQKVTEYYIEERYPIVVVSELSADEIRDSIDVANRIIKKIKESL